MSSNLNYYVPVKKKNNKRIYAELVVYGATPAGIVAAIQAKKMGLEVVIAEFGNHIGGITASGLGATDAGVTSAIGGMSRQFYEEIGHYYGKDVEWTFEPKVAKQVFSNWLKRYDVHVNFRQHVHDVTLVNGAIKQIEMEDGNIYEGKMFIDASYEGDLMARTNVSYYVGREANEQYKETLNGVHFGGPHHNFNIWIDPYVIEGDAESGVLPGITENDDSLIGYQGMGDKRIQAYNFRVCLTKEKKNMVPLPMPSNYNPDRYLLLLRYIREGFWDAMNLHTTLPNGKTDLNNFGAFSTDNIGMNWEWPEGSYQKREEIFQDHVSYTQGLLYFLANDRRVPSHVKREVGRWGLPKDEFLDTGHWPHQLYIRESRRMISDYVMTELNCFKHKVVDDSIGLASFHMDSHHCRRLVIDGRCVNEGDVQVPISPYPISYRAVRPKADECTNLLVPVCLSSSHIAYGSIRMEPVFMILGQSTGVAAALAIKNNTRIQDVNYSTLKEELINEGQILEWDDSIKDDPVARMKETFGGKSTTT